MNAGQVLVVPRDHFESLEDISQSRATHLVDVAMTLAPVVNRVGAAEGMKLLVNSAAAGQDVFQYHVRHLATTG